MSDTRKALFKAMIDREVNQILEDHCGEKYWVVELTDPKKQYTFYLKRLKALTNYNMTTAEQLLPLICRVAFTDPDLTDREAVNIIMICHDERWHKIFMEVNFNEGWN